MQVAKSGSVRLLLGADKLVQNLDLNAPDRKFTVKRASLASPHLLVMSDKGDLVLVTLEVSGSAQLPESVPFKFRVKCCRRSRPRGARRRRST